MVGTYITAYGTVVGFVETFRNGAWTPTTLPRPSGSLAPARSTAISCATADYCVSTALYSAPVAVYSPFGYTTDTESALFTLSGGKWSVSQSPAPSNLSAHPEPALTTLSCPATNACRAVGAYTAAGGVPSIFVVS